MTRQRTFRRIYGQCPVFDRLSFALFARQHPHTPVACRSIAARDHERPLAAHAGCVTMNIEIYEVRELAAPSLVNFWRCAFCSGTIYPPSQFPPR